MRKIVNFFKAHHVWQMISSVVTVVAGADALIPQVAVVSPHAAAGLAAAAGAANLLVTAHKVYSDKKAAAAAKDQAAIDK